MSPRSSTKNRVFFVDLGIHQQTGLLGVASKWKCKRLADGRPSSPLRSQEQLWHHCCLVIPNSSQHRGRAACGSPRLLSADTPGTKSREETDAATELLRHTPCGVGSSPFLQSSVPSSVEAWAWETHH